MLSVASPSFCQPVSPTGRHERAGTTRIGPRDAVTDGISLSEIGIDDGFWSPRWERNRDVTISYQYDQLEESGSLENFRRVAAGVSGGFRGMWFQDTDAHKWIEAASYVLSQRDDPELEAKVDEVISLIADAQQPDGDRFELTIKVPAGYNDWHPVYETIIDDLNNADAGDYSPRVVPVPGARVGGSRRVDSGAEHSGRDDRHRPVSTDLVRGVPLI